MDVTPSHAILVCNYSANGGVNLSSLWLSVATFTGTTVTELVGGVVIQTAISGAWRSVAAEKASSRYRNAATTLISIAVERVGGVAIRTAITGAWRSVAAKNRRKTGEHENALALLVEMDK